MLARYLHEGLHFDVERASSLTGMFGGWVWFLAVVGGAIADRLGFRRALSLAYLILSFAYFLMGSIGANWFAPVRNAVPLVPLVALILMLPALGVALVKPSVVGTTARASNEKVRSVGYSIYYTLVNVGSTAGPLLASWAQEHGVVENVFRIAALSVFLMLFLVLLLFKEPRQSGARSSGKPRTSRKEFSYRTFQSTIHDVSADFHRLLDCLLAGIHCAAALHLHVHRSEGRHRAHSRNRSDCSHPIYDGDRISNQEMHAFHAIVVGTLISSLAWILLIIHPSVWMAVATLAVVAVGEIVQAPRYYDYISRLAPPDQQGTYMGFAFLPLGIGSFIAGKFSGWLMRHFGEELHQPQMVWWSVIAVGVVTTLLLFIYDRVVRVETQEAT